ncbi:MAG: hypothetical protein CYG59_09085 [Chloroflexi bacterium]|nr:MAG: hypothetical protein CYG59_09085 [Chloroflexota bacterium]
MPWLFSFLLALYLISSTALSYAAAETGLRVWIRDLDARGVAGVQLTIIDAGKQARNIQTDVQGIALVAPLPGATVRIVRATGPGGQALLMDENDPDGGLRIPLQVGALQQLDLLISDGMLFVEPVAEAEDAPSAAVAPSVTSRSTTDWPEAVATPIIEGAPTPEAIARHSQWDWLRWLVVGVLVAIISVALAWQTRTILRARRAA